MTVEIKHQDLTNAAANPSVLVDGPKWDKVHNLTQDAGGVIGAAVAGASDVLSASAARTLLDVDPAGTDNSTDVTLAGTPDYITISGQEITRNQIDLTTDVTGTLPVANGGGGGVAALDGIDDVSDTTSVEGQSLFWDESEAEWVKAYRSPLDPTADLRDFLPSGYTASSGTAGSGTDVISYVNTALDAIKARYGRGKLLWPCETLRISAGPNTAKLAGIMIEGWGSQASKIHFDSNTGTAFWFTGEGGYTGGGLRGLGMFLDPAHTSSTATMVRLDGDATYQPDQTIFEDLYFTVFGSAKWANGFYAVGDERTSPQGIRIVTVKNMQIFGCSTVAVYISNAVGWTMENIGTYSGTGGGNDFYLAGGGTASTNTVLIRIMGLVCGGTINATNTTDFTLFGKCGGFATGTSFDYGSGWINNSGSSSGTIGSNTSLTVV